MKTFIQTIVTCIIVANFWHTLLAAESKSPTSHFNLSSSEKNSFQKFRILVEPALYKDYMKKDQYLFRWLQDAKFDEKKAQTKLLSTLEWRKSNNIDGILEEKFPEFTKICTYSVDGRDKMGRPIFTSGLGSCPVRKIMLGGLGPKYRRYNFQSFEKMWDVIQRLELESGEVTKVVGIVDMSGFNWREHACLQCIPFELEALTIHENHYPSFYEGFYLINTPRVFENILAIIRPLLSEESLKTMRIYGFNKEEWQKELLKFIPVEQLTPQFGGSKISTSSNKF